MRQRGVHLLGPGGLDGAALWCASLATATMFGAFALFGEVRPSDEMLASLTKLGRAFYNPERELPIYAAGCALAVGASKFIGRRSAKINGIKPREPSLADDGGSSPARARLWVDLLFCAAIVLLLYIPHPSIVAGECFATDRCHHWDFYAMAPTLAFAGGRALGTDAYCQYGVGWPMAFAAIGRWVEIGYATMISVAAGCGCAYFIGVYILLRRWTRSATWSIAGTLLVLDAQMFGGAIHSADYQPPLWQWPSSTILRSAFDVPLFIALLAHARSGHARWLMAAGATLGLAVLFGTDTGLYLAAAFAAYTLLSSRVRRSQAVMACTITIVCTSAGLALASRGTFTQVRFWSGWLEVFTLYPSGISLQRVFDLREGSLAGALAAMLIVGFFLYVACGYVRRRAADEPEDSDQLLLFCVAVYGLAYLVQYVGRSNPANLSHSSAPLVLLVVLHAWRSRAAFGAIAIRLRIPNVGAGVWPLAMSIILIASNRQVWWYPNIPHDVLARTHAVMPLVETSSDLLVRRSSEPISGRYREAILVLRAMHAEGRTFAIFANDDTALYLYAGQLPPGRYSPLLGGLLTQAQADAALEDLAVARPDYVLLPNGGAGRAMMRFAQTEDVEAAVRESVVAMGYVKDGVAGHLERWRRPLAVP